MLNVGVAERYVRLRLTILRNRNVPPNIVLPEPLEFNVAVLFALRIHDGWQHLGLSVSTLPIFDGTDYFMEAAWPLQTHRTESYVAKRQGGTGEAVTE